MPRTANIFRLLNKVNPDDPELNHAAAGEIEDAAATNIISRILSRLSALQWVVGLFLGVATAALIISWHSASTTSAALADAARDRAELARAVAAISMQLERLTPAPARPADPPIAPAIQYHPIQARRSSSPRSSPRPASSLSTRAP